MIDRVVLKFVKMHENAKLPVRNHNVGLAVDSGYDVFAVEDVEVLPNVITRVPIGLELAYVQPYYWIRVESRSGLFFKHGITVFNGIIDNGYRGEIGIALSKLTSGSYKISAGDRVAQLVLYKVIEGVLNWSETKDETSRGDKGFSSSGK